MTDSTERLPSRPSLESVRTRFHEEPLDKTPAMIPPASTRIPADLLKDPYPRISGDPKANTQYLDISEELSIQVDPEDDGGQNTQLKHPQNLFLQLARLKEQYTGSTQDLTDLLRIHNLLLKR